MNQSQLFRDIFDWDNALIKLESLNAKCEQESIWSDPKEAAKLMAERSSLEDRINQVLQIKQKLSDVEELRDLASHNNDQEILQEVKKELIQIEKLTSFLETECLFSHEMDTNGCFLEIHSGAGGTESDDWASMLLRLYLRYAERHKFKINQIDQLEGDEAGIKRVTLKFDGHNAYGLLKNESGIHRLVRISPFNSAGKRHTSFASVSVYPVVDNEINIEIQESDLRIDTYRSSGAGGQHVNTTDSAVRITHLPTNTVVQCQNNRSQHRNKEECMAMLKSKLYELEIKKKEEISSQENANKSEIGWGNQIRSYVLQPYQLVKDLRSGYETGDVRSILDGEIDDLIKAILKYRIK